MLWVPLAGVLAVLGVPREQVQYVTQVAIVPVWFLAAYLVVCTMVPLTCRLHDRFGLKALGAVALVAVVVDLLHRSGTPIVGWTIFLWVWGAIHQAGYLWHDHDRPASTSTARMWLPRSARGALPLALAGYRVLALLTTRLGYPVSMIGVEGATRSNTTPPSIALLALAMGQIGLALAFRGPATRLLNRPRVWAAIVVTGSFTMTLYLWHQTAMMAVVAALVPTGIWPVTAAVNATWWWQRPLWFTICTLLLPRWS